MWKCVLCGCENTYFNETCRCCGREDVLLPNDIQKMIINRIYPKIKMLFEKSVNEIGWILDEWKGRFEKKHDSCKNKEYLLDFSEVISLLELILENVETSYYDFIIFWEYNLDGTYLSLDKHTNVYIDFLNVYSQKVENFVLELTEVNNRKKGLTKQIEKLNSLGIKMLLLVEELRQADKDNLKYGICNVLFKVNDALLGGCNEYEVVVVSYDQVYCKHRSIIAGISEVCKYNVSSSNWHSFAQEVFDNQKLHKWSKADFASSDLSNYILDDTTYECSIVDKDHKRVDFSGVSSSRGIKILSDLFFQYFQKPDNIDCHREREGVW